MRSNVARPDSLTLGCSIAAQILAMRKKDLIRRLKRLGITSETDKTDSLPAGMATVLLKAVQVSNPRRCRSDCQSPMASR